MYERCASAAKAAGRWAIFSVVVFLPWSGMTLVTTGLGCAAVLLKVWCTGWPPWARD